MNAPPATLRYYQQHLPGSETYFFEDDSHEHHLEKTQEYLQDVRASLYRAEIPRAKLIESACCRD